MSLFKDTHFLVIEDTPDSHEDPENKLSRAEIEHLITDNGGQVFTRDRASGGAIEQLRIHHVITKTTDFSEYFKAVELMIPVTSPRWLVDSAAQNQKRNYRLYMPKPTPFMDKVVVCIADNLAQGDKEVMYAGVRAFGGQYLDALSRYTTHLIAVDLTNNKSVVAANILKKEGLGIRIVLPHWIDECMRQQRHVDETPYLLANPKVLQTGKPDSSVEKAPKISASAVAVLENKRVFLARDYHLSEHLKSSILSLIENSGGIVVHDFDPSNLDIYIGKYRSGTQFQACVYHMGIEVGTLSWLYHIVNHGQYISPLDSNLLHFPVPENEIPEFKNLRVSITGISGDARHYLSTLIVIMGATFTKTLDCNNDFLVCAQRSGDKYNAVKTRWPDVKIVNHLWIEECFKKWRFLDAKSSRYSSMTAQTPALGTTHISRSDLACDTVDENGAASDVGDSVNEGDELPIMTSPATKVPSFNSDSTQKKSQTTEVFSQDPIVVDTTISSSPANGRGRSAKAKASLRLHSDMEDLNQYTSMAKSSRKMKSYMEQLEKTAAAKAAQKNKKEVETVEEDVDEPKAKKAKVDKQVHLVAIMTGCESILTLTKTDVAKLSKIGIQIVNDYNPKKHIDTIIAPKVLRTEKFLKSLSKAKRIVHPSYLNDILNRHSLASLTWADVAKEFNIDHYSLDKVVPVKQINDDLGVAGKTSGLERLLSQEIAPVFSGFALNLSQNLNGGADLINSILREHGLSSSKTVKLTAGTRKSGLLSMENGTTILVAHKTKDKKPAANLEGVIVVEWEWCVKSIFHKAAQGYDDYRV